MSRLNFRETYLLYTYIQQIEVLNELFSKFDKTFVIAAVTDRELDLFRSDIFLDEWKLIASYWV